MVITFLLWFGGPIGLVGVLVLLGGLVAVWLV